MHGTGEDESQELESVPEVEPVPIPEVEPVPEVNPYQVPSDAEYVPGNWFGEVTPADHKTTVLNSHGRDMRIGKINMLGNSNSNVDIYLI